MGQPVEDDFDDVLEEVAPVGARPQVLLSQQDPGGVLGGEGLVEPVGLDRTLRTTTERPVTVTEGTNHLAGVEPEAIVRAAREVLADPPAPRRPALWDGQAAARIVDALLEGPPPR